MHFSTRALITGALLLLLLQSITFASNATPPETNASSASKRERKKVWWTIKSRTGQLKQLQEQLAIREEAAKKAVSPPKTRSPVPVTQAHQGIPSPAELVQNNGQFARIPHNVDLPLGLETREIGGVMYFRVTHRTPHPQVMPPPMPPLMPSITPPLMPQFAPNTPLDAYTVLAPGATPPRGPEF